jgi:flagellar hook protein FlgE
MLEVAGNNLANVNTFGFKASRITFSELLSQTIRQATEPTDSRGGTNPQQIGSGVAVGDIGRRMSQGNLVSTGKPLDMAIEGAGYFVLNDGEKDVFTRVGSFSVDADYHLVDPSTGHRVQRIGNEGVAEGFQTPSSSDIRVPFDVALPARATGEITFAGNLSADASDPTTNLLESGLQYTEGGAVASSATLLTALDQASGISAGETVRIYGTDRSGGAVDTNFTIAAGSTLGDLAADVDAAFSGSTASVANGEIRLADDTAGYSQTDLRLEYNGSGSFEVPGYFELVAAGGQETRSTSVEVYDSQGERHQLALSFVRTDTPNQWDIVLTSVSGDVTMVDRRVEGVSFGLDGSLSAVNDLSNFQLRYGGASAPVTTLDLDLGTVGEFDGLSQFGGVSTAAASGQDGYEAGWLSTVSVSRDGILQGMFTNGLRRDIASLKMATFRNPAGLTSVGGGYFQASGNSGTPVPTRALSGGAGSIHGGSLERSNVEVAQEFVSLIEAQNGFQANARAIRVTNDLLRELTNLIR